MIARGDRRSVGRGGKPGGGAAGGLILWTTLLAAGCGADAAGPAPAPDVAPSGAAVAASGVTISPSSVSLDGIGATYTFSVTVLGRNGQPISSPKVSWASLEPAVAAVDRNGKVTAVGGGTARITAASGKAADTAVVQVVVAASSPAAPGGGSGYSPPSSIAADCSTDVTTALNGWIASVPDSSTVSFGAGACYRVDGGLVVADRNGLTFEGNGATFRVFTKGAPDRANWTIRGGAGITFRNMIVRGANPNAGTQDAAYDTSVEWQHGFAFQGTQTALLDSVQVYDVYGDFAEAQHDPRVTFPGQPVRNLTVRNGRFERNGRMGFGLTHVDGFVLRDSYVGGVRWSAVDVELNDASEVGRNIQVLHNTFGAVRHSLLSNGGAGAEPNVGSIEFSSNIMAADPLTCIAPIDIAPPSGQYRSGFTFRQNQLRVYGAAVTLTRARNVTVDGNSLDFLSGGGCSQGTTGVYAADSHVGGVTNNTLTAASAVFKADPLTTDFTVSGNTMR
ncbi:MAG TPA: Ig-like domain-containing protein [Longimicrobiales bacterium]|nr:Ig-like domain-containing protein [Longimicrobiales bacterium]